jgi:ornithine decarboxylase
MLEDVKLINIIQEYIHDRNEWEQDEPFYVVNLNKIVEQYNKWITKLPNIKPYFAIKSNPDIKIIKLLSTLGCNFDCASKNEIATILNIVDDESRIIFANPCKMSSHITFARDNGVHLMTFDCVEELFKIHKINRKAELVLRLCVDDSDSICKFNSKFGCKLENIDLIFKIVKELNANLVGFSFHVGSGCQNAHNYFKAIQDCKFAYLLASKYNIHTIRVIDIGGGFPGSEDNVDNKVMFDEICDNIIQAQNRFFKQKIDSKEISFIAEPGRFFTESTHTLVINVIAKKIEDTGIKYYLNEGVYGSFNCLHFDHQTPKLNILPLNENDIQDIDKRPILNSTFFGPTCDSMDFIYKDIPFKELEIGTWLYVKNFGSYTVAPSISFNGFGVLDFHYIYPDNASYNSLKLSPSSSISSFSF